MDIKFENGNKPRLIIHTAITSCLLVNSVAVVVLSVAAVLIDVKLKYFPLKKNPRCSSCTEMKHVAAHLQTELKTVTSHTVNNIQTCVLTQSVFFSCRSSLHSSSSVLFRCVIDQLFIANVFAVELLPLDTHTARQHLLISSYIDCDHTVIVAITHSHQNDDLHSLNNLSFKQLLFVCFNNIF